jgi:hypothetical protein
VGFRRYREELEECRSITICSFFPAAMKKEDASSPGTENQQIDYNIIMNA